MALKRFVRAQEIGFSPLLIAPYGIETSQSGLIASTRWLLIAPYGIETPAAKNNHAGVQLLIAPYGIETKEDEPPAWAKTTFNRTLWH